MHRRDGGSGGTGPNDVHPSLNRTISGDLTSHILGRKSFSSNVATPPRRSILAEDGRGGGSDGQGALQRSKLHPSLAFSLARKTHHDENIEPLLPQIRTPVAPRTTPHGPRIGYESTSTPFSGQSERQALAPPAITPTSLGQGVSPVHGSSYQLFATPINGPKTVYNHGGVAFNAETKRNMSVDNLLLLQNGARGSPFGMPGTVDGKRVYPSAHLKGLSRKRSIPKASTLRESITAPSPHPAASRSSTHTGQPSRIPVTTRKTRSQSGSMTGLAGRARSSSSSSVVPGVPSSHRWNAAGADRSMATLPRSGSTENKLSLVLREGESNWAATESRKRGGGLVQSMSTPLVHLKKSSISTSFDHSASACELSQDELFTPQSFKMVRPLQAAFMSTGMLNKRTRARMEEAAQHSFMQPPGISVTGMPDTPCKGVPLLPTTSDGAESGAPTSNGPRLGQGLLHSNIKAYQFPNNVQMQLQRGLGQPNFVIGSTSSQDEEMSPTVWTHARKASIEAQNKHRIQVLGPSGQSGDSMRPTELFDLDTPTRPNSGSLLSVNREDARVVRRVGRRTSYDRPPSPLDHVSALSNGIPLLQLMHQPTQLSLLGEQQNSSSPRSASSDFAQHTRSADESSGDSPEAMNNLPSGGSTHLERLVTDFSIVESIGSGEFSEAFKVEYRSTGEIFAVKRTRAATAGPKERARRWEEVSILRQLASEDGSPNVLRFVEAWEEESGALCIQTELCGFGTLAQFLDTLGRLPEQDPALAQVAGISSDLRAGCGLDEWRVWKTIVEVGSGLRHIHSHEILHLDLKPANIFIGENGTLKIGDFGLAVRMPGFANYDRTNRDLEREGDREYIAPEILAKGAYGPPADIFSFGLTILEAATNAVLPDNGSAWQNLREGNLRDVYEMVANEQAESTPVLNAEQIPGWTSHVLQSPPLPRLQTLPSDNCWSAGRIPELVKALIVKDPSKRLSLDNVLSLPLCQRVLDRIQLAREQGLGPPPGALMAEDPLIWTSALEDVAEEISELVIREEEGCSGSRRGSYGQLIFSSSISSDLLEEQDEMDWS